MNRRQFLHTVPVALASASGAFGADKVNPATAKLALIPQRLKALVDRQLIAGAVTLVAHGGKVLALDAVGYADLAAKKAMRADDLFWIASMTKPITGTARSEEHTSELQSH